ncbi:UNVERIFIED_CONTAM: 3-isopropylmalate dehydratase large subunit, partial [Salmonella enterica subsp. enterica serovar Weltevreden]
DETTFAYLEGRPYSPKGAEWEEGKKRWRAFASDPDARHDDVVTFRAEELPPTVTWGINPAQAIPVDGRIPLLEELSPEE